MPPDSGQKFITDNERQNMSDWFYDSKGIRHGTKEGAEGANWMYLQEERGAREKLTEATEQMAQEANRHLPFLTNYISPPFSPLSNR
jgi:hypothetical protein